MKDNNKISKIILVIVVATIFIIFFFFLNGDSQEDNTISKYDDSLKEIGYQKKSNTYYYGNDLNLSIIRYDTKLSIELRDRLKDYDWTKYLDTYLKTINLFVDFDSELFSKGIEYVINNSIDSEINSNIRFSFPSYSISIYFYPKDNLSIRISFNKYSVDNYIYYSAYNIVNQKFDYDKLVFEKLFKKEVPIELLKRMSENVLQKYDNNTVSSMFRLGNIYADFDSLNGSSFDIYYSLFDNKYNFNEMKLTYKKDYYHDEIEKDLEFLDGIFKKDIVKYKDKIIDLIENPKTEYHVSEKTNYTEKYSYNTFTLSDEISVRIYLYEKKIIITYQFEESL